MNEEFENENPFLKSRIELFIVNILIYKVLRNWTPNFSSVHVCNLLVVVKDVEL